MFILIPWKNYGIVVPFIGGGGLLLVYTSAVLWTGEPEVDRLPLWLMGVSMFVAGVGCWLVDLGVRRWKMRDELAKWRQDVAQDPRKLRPGARGSVPSPLEKPRPYPSLGSFCLIPLEHWCWVYSGLGVWAMVSSWLHG